MNYYYSNAAKPRHVYENQMNVKTYENSAAMDPEDGYEVPESESNFLVIVIVITVKINFFNHW